MEVILLFIGILLLSAFVFLLIEYPYYLVSVFVFLHLYNFNLEMSGPLDLRGLISVILFMRLVIFDKKNLDLIRELLSNKFFILLVIFSLYSSIVDFFSIVNLLVIVRLLILNYVALLLGFLTIVNGYGKKTIVLAILIAGLFSTGDLIYSYFIEGSLLIKRIVEVIISGGTAWETMNHNFFGELCGIGFITTFLLLITKTANKIISFILLAVFSLGIMISTSRGTILSVIITVVLILITQKALDLNFKKVFFSGLVGIILIIIVALSYSYILSAMKIKSEFADTIYYRLVEEPLSFLDDDSQKFGWNDNKVQGTMRWRYYKYLRDGDVFFKQNISTILFGFGSGGYRKIGGIEYVGTEAIRYSSHNFYINLVAESGIIGLLLFFLFFFSLLFSAVKMLKKGWIQFSLVYIILFGFSQTIGGDPNLNNKFSFILYGGIIGEIALVTYIRNRQNESQN